MIEGGLYNAAASMISSVARLARLANNAANIATPGYKQDVTLIRSFGDVLLSQIRPYSGGIEIYPVGDVGSRTLVDAAALDMTQGPLMTTQLPLDLALEGPGLLCIQQDDGIYYTRDGSFGRNTEGYLVAKDGGLVLGQAGALHLPDGEVFVDSAGAISVDGVSVDSLRLVDFAPEVELTKVGANYLKPADDSAVPLDAAAARVLQGYLEGSNVDAVAVMVEMMSATRTYEASQRILQLQNQVLGRAVNDLGSLS